MRISSAAADYANVFFEVCQEQKITNQIMYELKQLLQINNSEIIRFLSIPIITMKIKKDILSSLEEIGVNKIVINLMKVLIDNNDLYLFREVLKEFQNIFQIKKDIKIVFVTSAKSFDSEILDNIRIGLEKQLNAFVVLSTNVEPKLIGGVKFEYDGKIIDNTVLKQLSVMKSALNK
ncbi:MAG: ATP synthase F1 subunit delta [Mycoplasmatales bacterium]